MPANQPITVEVYLVLNRPKSPIEPARDTQARSQMLISQIAATKLDTLVDDESTIRLPISFDVVQDPESLSVLKGSPPSPVLDRVVLRARVEVDTPTVSYTGAPIPAEEMDQLRVPFALDDAERTALDVLLLSTIAIPGSFWTSSVITTAPPSASQYREAFSCSRLSDVIQHTVTRGWPSLRELPFADVWRWGVGLRLGSGIAKGPAGRALAALAYVLEHSEEPASPAALLWALIGLEALYTEGTGNLTHQIVDKTQALLGRRAMFKNELAKVYAMRSRIIHGDLDIPLPYCREYMSSPVEGFDQDTEAAARSATAALLASIQHLVTRNSYALRFEYHLRT